VGGGGGGGGGGFATLLRGRKHRKRRKSPGEEADTSEGGGNAVDHDASGRYEKKRPRVGGDRKGRDQIPGQNVNFEGY